MRVRPSNEPSLSSLAPYPYSLNLHSIHPTYSIESISNLTSTPALIVGSELHPGLARWSHGAEGADRTDPARLFYSNSRPI